MKKVALIIVSLAMANFAVAQQSGIAEGAKVVKEVAAEVADSAKVVQAAAAGVADSAKVVKAAATGETPALPTAPLPKAPQVQKVEEPKADETTKAESWVGLGKEVGEAIKAGLKAAGEEAENFSQTTPRKTTIFLICWKIMAKDAIELCSILRQDFKAFLIGVPFLVLINLAAFRLYYNTTQGTRVLVKEDGKVKTYDYRETWYTRQNADTDGILTFNICFWILMFLTNILVFCFIF